MPGLPELAAGFLSTGCEPALSGKTLLATACGDKLVKPVVASDGETGETSVPFSIQFVVSAESGLAIEGIGLARCKRS